MWWTAAAAWALDVRAYAPLTAARAGAETRIELAVADAGEPISGAKIEVVPRRGRLLAQPQELSPGRWAFDWVVPGGVSEEVFTVSVGRRAPVEVLLPVDAFVPSALHAPPVTEAAAGVERLELVFDAPSPPDPEQVVVRASEGELLGVVASPRGLVVQVAPDARRDARVLHVGVWDRRAPDRLPAFASVRLRERKSGTVDVEPRSAVVVKLGGRSYGPFVADDAGHAEIAFDVLPGEQTYEVVATDVAGNSSRVSNPLGGNLARPVVVLLESEEEHRASVLVAAWTGAGNPWAGAVPTCRAATGERKEATPLDRGLWRFDVAEPRNVALFDLRVECAVGEVALPVRVPLGADLPASIKLSAFPDALDADLPIAQVQALLLDRRGDRLPVDGLELSARHGWLALDRGTPDALRADYQGADAVAAGGDEIVATWSPPGTRGSPWNLHLEARREAGRIRVRVLAHDRRGQVVQRAPVSVDLRDGGAVLATATGETDDRGELELHLQGIASLPVLTARSGGAAAATAILGQSDPELPSGELGASLALPMRAGRVRRVALEAPAQIFVGDDSDAELRVRLFDQGDNLVADEGLVVESDYGEVVGLKAEPDGSWRARLSVPRRLVDRDIHVTATAGGASRSAVVRVQPRPVRGGLAVGGGYVTNFGVVSSPMATMRLDARMPFLPQLNLRLGFSGYWIRSSYTDEISGKAVNVDANLFPIELGAMAVQRWTTVSLGGGVAALFVPYGMKATYAGETVVDAPGLTSPGIQVTGEAAWRFQMSELYIDLRGMIHPGPTGVVTVEGNPVNLAAGAGFRVLY